jgi:hypothetical protein
MANLTMAGTKDHPITIGPIAERVRVVWRGRTIGDSKHALELREANYPPVVYVPRADMDMSALKRTARVTTPVPTRARRTITRSPMARLATTTRCGPTRRRRPRSRKSRRTLRSIPTKSRSRANESPLARPEAPAL